MIGAFNLARFLETVSKQFLSVLVSIPKYVPRYIAGIFNNPHHTCTSLYFSKFSVFSGTQRGHPFTVEF